MGADPARAAKSGTGRRQAAEEPLKTEPRSSRINTNRNRNNSRSFALIRGGFVEGRKGGNREACIYGIFKSPNETTKEIARTARTRLPRHPRRRRFAGACVQVRWR